MVKAANFGLNEIIESIFFPLFVCWRKRARSMYLSRPEKNMCLLEKTHHTILRKKNVSLIAYIYEKNYAKLHILMWPLLWRNETQ